MRHHQTTAHHTGPEVVAFLGGGVYVYRALDRDSRHGGKAAALSLKSIPRPGLTQLGLDFLALSKSGCRHFLTLDAGMGFPPLVHPASSRFAGPDRRTSPPRLAVQGHLNDHTTRHAV